MSQSPKITHIEWGQIEVAGESSFKDAKLWPGGARAWDWNETGTEHVPGIQPADVQELLDHGAQTVILSKGMHERLQTADETFALLDEQGIGYEQLETNQAVECYNHLAEQGEAVGALIHSTC